MSNNSYVIARAFFPKQSPNSSEETASCLAVTFSGSYVHE